jgi:hypothetical protein
MLISNIDLTTAPSDSPNYKLVQSISEHAIDQYAGGDWYSQSVNARETWINSSLMDCSWLRQFYILHPMMMAQLQTKIRQAPTWKVISLRVLVICRDVCPWHVHIGIGWSILREGFGVIAVDMLSDYVRPRLKSIRVDRGWFWRVRTWVNHGSE